jgi:hypothetical protein
VTKANQVREEHAGGRKSGTVVKRRYDDGAGFERKLTFKSILALLKFCPLVLQARVNENEDQKGRRSDVAALVPPPQDGGDRVV